MLRTARSTRPKPLRGPSTAIHYLGQNFTDRTVTFIINGARWEYWLTPLQIESIEYLTRVSLGKALAYAKKHASYARSIQ